MMPRYVMAHSPQLEDWHPEAQVLVEMSPDAFSRALGTAMEGFEHFKDKETVERLKSRMSEGLEIDPGYIDYDPFKNQVVRHEGRHRADAAKELGINMPVIVYFYDTRKDGQKHPVTSPYGDVYDYTRYVSREELGPERVQRILTKLNATPVTSQSTRRRSTPVSVSHSVHVSQYRRRR